MMMNDIVNQTILAELRRVAGVPALEQEDIHRWTTEAPILGQGQTSFYLPSLAVHVVVERDRLPEDAAWRATVLPFSHRLPEPVAEAGKPEAAAENEPWLLRQVLRFLEPHSSAEHVFRVCVVLFVGYFLAVLSIAVASGAFARAVR